MKANQSWQRFKQFVTEDVWEIDVSSLSARRSLPIRLLRVGQIVFKGFQEDDLPVHASALTFVTLMSLVPMLAVAFALLKGFGFGQERVQILLGWTEAMPVEFQSFIQQMLDIVSTTNFAAMGWVGLGFVIFTAILVLGSVELTFDRIWGVARPRNVIRKVANYVSILVLVPVLIGIASTLETTLHGAVPFMPQAVGSAVRSAMRLTTLFTTWLAFFSLYIFLPNTRVRALPAIISSLVGAIIWVIWQRAFITLQLGVARYNAIYGTFASVPIFLAWLYTSWVIVLLGAELAFALQNASTYSMESAAVNASYKSRFMLTLSIVLHAAEAMVGDKPRFSTSAFAREHHVPIRLLNDLVRMLVRAGYLVETAGRESSYVLTRAADSLTVREIFDLVTEEGAHPEKMGSRNLGAGIEGVLGGIEKGVGSALGEMTVRDLMEEKGGKE
jgi:membrane protein